MGTEDEEGTQVPSEESGEEKMVTKKADEGSNASSTESSGEAICPFA